MPTGPTGAWEPLPGRPDAQLRLPEWKGDPWSAQATLVQTPRALLVIDPGCAPEQTAVVSQAVEEFVSGNGGPVLVLLTHAHWDHAAAIADLPFPPGAEVHFCAHSAGAEVLHREDDRASCAYLFNSRCPRVAVDAPLFGDGATAPIDNQRKCGSVCIVSDEIVLASGRRVPYESLQVGDEELARVFHTPGHSPDSVCCLAGEVLWVGDLLLAANPAVAGVPGWDRDALIDSLEILSGILEVLPVSMFCPGHGRRMSPEKARQGISRALDQARSLDEVATLDAQRVSLLVDCSEDLLNESLELFTIVAGRLLSVSFHLDALEEPGEAAKVVEALDIDGLDGALDELQRFAEHFRKHRKLEMALPMKAVQTVGRAEKVLLAARLEDLIDPLLLRRARYLLDDFMRDVRGIEPPSTLTVEEPGPLIAHLAGSLAPSAGRLKDLWDIEEGEKAFQQALTRNLAAQASSVHLKVDLDLAPDLPRVSIDRIRFENALHAILSDFAGAGATRVAVAVRPAAEGCRVSIQPTPERVLSCFSPRKLRFLERSMGLAGAALSDVSTASTTCLSISLSPR